MPPMPRDAHNPHTSIVGLYLEDLSQFESEHSDPFLELIRAHIVGRQRANEVRVLIENSRLTDTGTLSQTRIKPTESRRTPKEKASSRLTGARQAVASYRMELNTKKEKLARLELEALAVNRDVVHRRQCVLLLNVLKTKSELRVHRMQEIDKLLVQLRETISSEPHSIHETSLPKEVVKPHLELAHLPDANITHDTLSTLHAYHVKLNRVVNTSLTRLSDTEIKRMERRVGPQAVKMLKNEAARELRPEFPDDAIPNGISHRSLEEVAHDLHDKSSTLQTLSDKIAALKVFISNSKASISTFNISTGPALVASIAEETNTATGAVDILAEDILKQHATTPENEFKRQVLDVLRLSHISVDTITILREVERISKSAKEKDVALTRATIRTEDVQDEGSRSLLEGHVKSTADFDTAVMKLLQRKIEKVEIGQAVKGDVEVLLGEMRYLVGA